MAVNGLRKIIKIAGEETCRIDGHEFDCFTPDEPSNYELTAGDFRDSATPEVWIEKDLFSNRRIPEQGTDVKISGRTLQVLGTITDKKTHYVFVLGLQDGGGD